jgi:hypothetical protein
VGFFSHFVSNKHKPTNNIQLAMRDISPVSPLIVDHEVKSKTKESDKSLHFSGIGGIFIIW